MQNIYDYDTYSGPANPIEFDTLTEEEQRIARTTVNEGEYEVCHSSSDAMQRLIDRAYEHVEQQEDDSSVYFHYNELYEIGIYVLDEKIP
ncbi:hypothetical protein ACFQH3_02065 [Haladaptatus sp. GCM10025707]|uniref:hypothetical protein n=1 Tax=unclassified Haladaptatus TaxID=2622732 RepID=UPI0023E8CCA2|nr:MULTISPECIES: hypothetical protein [unclassified Haladaptatus]